MSSDVGSEHIFAKFTILKPSKFLRCCRMNKSFWSESIPTKVLEKFINMDWLILWQSQVGPFDLTCIFSLKISNFASTKFTFRNQINENELVHLENGTEIEPSVNYVRLKCELLSWSHLKSSALKTNQISTLQFEAFCHSKTETSWFSLQLFMRGSNKSTLNLKEFDLLNFQNYWYTFDETK